MRYTLLILFSLSLHATEPLTTYLPRCMSDVKAGWSTRDQHSNSNKMTTYPYDDVLNKYCTCLYMSQEYYNITVTPYYPPHISM